MGATSVKRSGPAGERSGSDLWGLRGMTQPASRDRQPSAQRRVDERVHEEDAVFDAAV